ncbi:MAG: transposase [Thermoguttaceae bacterium]
MSRTRKHYIPEEKVALLKRRLVEKVPVSDLCDELGLNPIVFYTWQKQLFENGAAAFEKTRRRQADRRDQKIERLEAKLALKNEVLAELMQEHVQLKKTWGALKGSWVPHDIRDQVVDFVGRWSQRSQIAIRVLVLWLGISLSKFYDWRKRYGKVHEHNALVPRDHWLVEEEKQAILEYERNYPLEGYRRLALHDARRRRGGGQPGDGVSGAQVGGSLGAGFAPQ